MCSEGEIYTQLLEEREEETLKSYALISKERKALTYFREHGTAPLEYRTEYHRDRDRIIWSKSFKRLQHKTQVYPHYVEDHYRRRLTHSLEVAQIATTIARALAINEVATEAIALGHDLGHTPFGHAGENALNEILLKEGEKYKDVKVPMCGFNHCVHAIEVISRIEQDYKIENKHDGLNLTFDIKDGILKHMHDSAVDHNKPLANISEVVKIDTYKDFNDNKGSLEAQCVYFADKLAYLISDIEDGIRCDIFSCRELKDDEFIKFIWNQYNETRKKKEELKLDSVDDFLLFRRKVLTVLILDCIKTSTKKIEENKIKKIDHVLSCKERIIHISDIAQKHWDIFYKIWMEGKLYIDKDVSACNFKAKKIIRELFEAFIKDMNLIGEKYRESCNQAYRKHLLLGDNGIMQLITVRNYIAGMTDAFAIDQHARLYMSSERVRF